MRYLMLMWADADAASGDESDLQAWVEFDAQVKAGRRLRAQRSTRPGRVRGSPGSDCDSRARDRRGGGARPFAEGKRQIQAFYIMDLPDMDAAVEWANRLPTYGYVEVRELLQF